MNDCDNQHLHIGLGQMHLYDLIIYGSNVNTTCRTARIVSIVTSCNLSALHAKGKYGMQMQLYVNIL